MGTARFSIAAALATTCLLYAQQPKAKLGDNSAGSRGQPAHIIALRDSGGDTIEPGDRHALPFSVTQTCGGDCHDVATITRGWHFDAALPGVPPGRNGQPWLLVDRETATQIPLSYRAWPGTYRPHELGMGNFRFAVTFGGRTAGGIGPEDASAGESPATSMLTAWCATMHRPPTIRRSTPTR